jgi:hypothetical protein
MTGKIRLGHYALGETLGVGSFGKVKRKGISYVLAPWMCDFLNSDDVCLFFPFSSRT